MTNYKGLLATDNVEAGSTSTTAIGGLTIPKQLYPRLLEAVRRNLVWRPLAAFSFGPNDIPGSSVDVDLETEGLDGLDVVQVAEGGEFPTMSFSIDTFNLKPVKYGVRLPITEEMLEDGKWNLLDRAVQIAGYKVAKKQDSLIINTIDTNRGNSVSGGAAITVANIASGMQNLEDNGYNPTDFIIGTEVANDIRNIDIFVQADKSGVTNPSEALIGKIFNMNVWISNNLGQGNLSAKTSSYVLDRQHAFIYAEKRAVTIKAFEEMWKDIQNRIVSFRFIARYLRANASCEITTS